MAVPEAQAATEVAMGAAAQHATMDVASGLASNVPDPTLLDCIVCDHRSVMTLFTHFNNAAIQGNQHLMQMHVAAIMQEVQLHSQAEEAVLYPLLTSMAAEHSSSLVTHCLNDHKQVEGHILAVLGAVGCKAGTPILGTDLVTCMQRMQAELAAHIQQEEQVVLPKLAAAFDREQLVLHGQNFLQAKQTARLLPQAAPLPLATPGLAAPAAPSAPAAMPCMDAAVPMADSGGASEGALLASSMEGVEAEVGASLAGMLPTPCR